MIGPIPRATRQFRFCIVVVDYFTKYIEVQPLATITSDLVISFLWNNILYKYGSPRVVITDNGTQFSSNKEQEWAKRNYIQSTIITNNIQMLNALVAHPPTVK